MPADANPQTARPHNPRMVHLTKRWGLSHLERFNRRQADNVDAIVTSLEMEYACIIIRP
jgi:hypothetical protein